MILSDQKDKVETFDSVIVANGHHAYPYWATISGMDKLKCKVTHSHEYKDQAGFENKRILVVGLGNSGGDIGVELSRTASQVHFLIIDYFI